MSSSITEILPTLIGATIFGLFAMGVIAALSAIASRIEDRYHAGEITTDIGVDRRPKIPKRRAA